MGLMDKFKNLFTDEEIVDEEDENESIEIKEIKKEEEHKLPTFMREKIEREQQEKEREQEVKNSFIIKDKDNLLKDKNVILIDDIFTTASTTNEISKLLRLIPVNKITVLTLLTRARDTYISDKEND